jgi:hypothetical protein
VGLVEICLRQKSGSISITQQDFQRPGSEWPVS